MAGINFASRLNCVRIVGFFVQKQVGVRPVVTFVNAGVSRIRIKKVPPSGSLEGIDLRPYQFLEGQVYGVSARLAEVLIVWGYAELERQYQPRDRAADRKRSR
jgi:hypothetical protein